MFRSILTTTKREMNDKNCEMNVKGRGKIWSPVPASGGAGSKPKPLILAMAHYLAKCLKLSVPISRNRNHDFLSRGEPKRWASPSLKRWTVGILFQTLHFPVFISSACIKKLQIVDGSGAVDNDERDWRLSHTE